MLKWYENAVFYHMYPLGMTGAPKRNEGTEAEHRLPELEQWLPHLVRLGCNAIYIGPLFESTTHGYDTKDYKLVDRRLGDNEDFSHFVKEAHRQGIRVVVDGVFNHTGREFFAFRDIQEKREKSAYCSWYKGIDLIGTDTFRNNEVQLRKGIIYQCAQNGGFGVLDEINMAKNDAVSVLHATLDYRRSIDVPGYDKIELHPAARFIGTMNYGYAGTKELNEALVSRFLVIDMPPQDEETLTFILGKTFPTLKEEAREQFIGLFLDLQLKAKNSEISTKSLDLRGLLAALKVVEAGLSPLAAVRMGITNKTFDMFEKEIVEDVVMTRIPSGWTSEDVFWG